VAAKAAADLAKLADDTVYEIDGTTVKTAATTASLAGLKAVVTALNAATGETSVTAKIAAAIGEPSLGNEPATGLWAKIEAYITNVVLDKTPPMAPIVSLLHDNGTNTADGITNDGTLKVQGIESGATVEYRVGSNPWTTTAPTASPGSNNIFVRQLDAAGNASEAAQIQFVLDVAAPTVMSVNSTLPSDVYKAGVVVPIEVHFSKVIQVTGSPVLTLDLVDLIAGGSREVTYSSGSGTDTLTFNYTVKPGDRAAWLSATFLNLHGASVQDIAGNQADLTLNGVTLNGLGLDTTPPATPVITATAGNNDSYAGGFTVTRDSSVFLVGANLSDFVKVEGDTVNVYTAKPGAFLGTEHVTVNATASDLAGNTSSSTMALKAIDTTAPAAPTFALMSDTGAADGVTKVNTIKVSGIVNGNAWQYKIGAEEWTSGVGGAFNLPEGQYAANSIQVRQIDAAGNVSITSSNSSSIEVDVTAPNAPSINTVAGDDVFSDGIEGSGTGSHHMTINGRGEAGSTITLVSNNATTTVDPYGDWTLTVDNALTQFGQGAEVLVFTQTDAAGNVSQIGTHAISVRTGISGSATYLLGNSIKNTLSGMDDIHVTGDTSHKDASSLMKVQNSGITKFDNIKLTYLQAATLPVDANDNILKITVTGLNFSGQSVLVDLSAYDASTAIWYTGASANEAVMVSASDANGNGRYLNISGGSGNDEVRIIEAFDSNGVGIESKITGELTDSAGADTLTIVGQIDISQANISGFESLQLLEGSPSRITLSANQLGAFQTIIGSGSDANQTVITVAGSNSLTSVDLSGKNLTGVAEIKIGEQVQLEMSADQLASVELSHTASHEPQDFGGTLRLVGSLSDNLDLTDQVVNIDLSGLDAAFHVNADGAMSDGFYTITLPNFAAGQKLIVAADQLVGPAALLASGVGELIVRGDFTSTGTVDLTGVSYKVNFDDQAFSGGSAGVSVGQTTTLRMTANQLIINSTGAIDTALGIGGNGTLELDAENVADGKILDLKPLGSGLKLDFVQPGGSGFVTGQISVGIDAVLAINATHASGERIGGAQGWVDIYALENKPDLDLSKFSAGLAQGYSVTIYVTSGETVAYNQNLNLISDDHASQSVSHYGISLGENSYLTLDAAQADGRTIDGPGSSTITVLGLQGNTKLNDITDAVALNAQVEAGDQINITSNNDLSGVDEFSVMGNATLTLSAAQATDRNIFGQNAAPNGVGGSVVITLLSTADGDQDGVSDAVYDFTQVQAGGVGAGTDAGTVVVQIEDTQTLNPDTDLGDDAQVRVSQGKTVTLSATQATDRIVDGTGSLVVTDITAETNLDSVVLPTAGSGDVVNDFSGIFRPEAWTSYDNGSGGQGTVAVLSGSLSVVSPDSQSPIEAINTIAGAGQLSLHFTFDESKLGIGTIAVNIYTTDGGMGIFLNDLPPVDFTTDSYGGLQVIYDSSPVTGQVSGLITFNANVGDIVKLICQGAQDDLGSPIDTSLNITSLAFTPSVVAMPGLASVTATVTDADLVLSNTDYKLSKVDTFDVKDGAKLTLTAEKAHQKNFISNDAMHTGVLHITGLESQVTADLSGVSTELQSTAFIDAAGGVTLKANVSTMATVDISGAGTVTVHAEATVGTNKSFSVRQGATLSLSASDANLIHSIESDGTSRIDITSAVATDSYDFSGVNGDNFSVAAVTVFYSTGGVLAHSLSHHTADIAQGQTLTLSALRADDQYIVGGGTVTVTDLGSAPDADLTHLTASEVNVVQTLDNETVTFIGDLGHVQVSTSGTGTLDLTGVNSLGADATFTVGTGTTLSIEADDVTGKTVSGPGSLRVIDLISGTVLLGAFSGANNVNQYVRTLEPNYSTEYGSIQSGDYSPQVFVQKVDISEFVGSTVDIYHQIRSGDSNITLRDGNGDLVVAKEDEDLFNVLVQNGYFLELSFYEIGASPVGFTSPLRLKIFTANDNFDNGTPLFDQTYVLGAAGLATVEAVIADVAGGVDITGNVTLSGVTQYTVPQDRSLTLTADQADGIASGGAGTVTVVDLGSNTTADLSLLDSDTVNIAQTLGGQTLTFTGDLGDAHVITSALDSQTSGELNLTGADMGEDATFAIGQSTTVVFNAQAAHGLTTSGAGITAIAGLTGTHGLSLGNVHTPTITMMLVGHTTLDIQTMLPDADLVVISNDAYALNLEALGQQNFPMSSTHGIALGGKANLELTADQADGLHVNALNGINTSGNTVTLTGGLDVKPATDLSYISDDLQLTVNITVDTDLSAQAPSKLATVDKYEVSDGITLTLSAAQATARDFAGQGRLVVTDLMDNTNLDGVALNAGYGFVSSPWSNSSNTLTDAVSVVITSNEIVLNDGNPTDYFRPAVRKTFDVDGQGSVRFSFSTDELGNSYKNLLRFDAENNPMSGVGFGDDLNNRSGQNYSVVFDSPTDSPSGRVTGTINFDVLAGSSVGFQADAANGTNSNLTLSDFNFVPTVALAIDSLVVEVVHPDLNIIGNSYLSSVDTFDVKPNAKLTLSATQANGKGLIGSGAVTIADLANDTDLSKANTTDLTITATVSGPVDLTNNTTDADPDGGLVKGITQVVDLFDVSGALTMTAKQASGATATGSGAVTLTGLHNALGADLNGLTVDGGITIVLSDNATLSSTATLAHTDLTVQGAYTLDISAVDVSKLGLTPTDLISVDSDATLSMTAAQADGLKAQGQGTVHVTGLASHSMADLSQFSATLNLTADITVNTNLSAEDAAHLAAVDKYEVSDGITLTLSAQQATARDFAGQGRLVVTDLMDNTNLDGVALNAGYGFLSSPWSNSSNTMTDAVSVVITSNEIVLNDGNPTDSFRPAVRKTFDVDGQGSVRFSFSTDELGNSYKNFLRFDAENYPMTGVGFGDDLNNSAGQNYSVEFDSPTDSPSGRVTGTINFDVLAGSSVGFQADAANGTNSNLTLSDFNFVPTVAPAIDSLVVEVNYPDLNITANTHLSTVDTFDVKLNAKLTLSATQANGKGLIGSGAVTIADLANDTDLSKANTTDLTITATVTGPVDLTNNTTDANPDAVLVKGITQVVDLFDVSGALTMTAKQASGATATGTGAVTLTGLHNALGADLYGLTVDGGITIVLGQDAVLSNTATLAHTDLTVQGAYTLDISAVDVSKLGLDAFDLITLGSGTTLTLTAVQADGLNAVGSGTVHVTALESNTSAELISLDNDGLTLNVSVDVTGNEPVVFTGQLGNAHVAVSGAGALDVRQAQQLGGNATFDLGDGATLKIDAAAVSARTVTGTGSLAIDKLTAGIDLQNVTTGEQAPVPVNDFVGVFSPVFANDKWIRTQNTELNGTVSFNQDGNELVLRGLAGVGPEDNGSVSVSGPWAPGVVSFHYDFDQQGAEYFQYFNNGWVRVSASDSDVITLPAGSQLSFSVGSDDPDWTVPASSSTLTISNFIYTPQGGGVQGLASISATLAESDQVDISGNQTGADKIGTFDLGNQSTLQLTADQANGKTIQNLNGAVGSTIIDGDVLDNTDLTGVSTTLSFDDGDLGISIAAGKTLTLTAQQAVIGGPISGSGTLNIRGNTASITDLDLHEVSSGLQFSNGQGNLLSSVTVVAGQTLTLNLSQVDVAFDVVVNAASGNDAAGTLHILGLNSDTNLDGAGISGAGKVVVEVLAAGETDLTSNAHLDVVDEFIVNSGSDVKLDASLAHDRAVTGSGNVHINALDVTNNANLSGIDTSGTMTAEFTASETFSGSLGKVHVTVSADATMTLSADRANGKFISGAEDVGKAGGSVVITGMVGQTNYDFSHIHAGGNAEDQGTNGSVIAQITTEFMTLGGGTDLGEVQLQLGDGATLTMDVTQAASKSIVLMAGQGQMGHLVLKADVYSGEVDLTTIQVSSLDFDGGITVGNSATLKLTADQADGQTIRGSAPSTVIISGDVLQGTSVDLRGIEHELSFADAIEGQMPTLAVAKDATLDLRAAQATGKSITGLGTVRVHGLNSDTQLDGVDVDHVTVVFDASDDVSSFTVSNKVEAFELNNGAVVLFNAAQMNGISVTGDGQAALGGDITTGTVDWLNLSSNLNFGQDGTIRVDLGATLKITAAQADYLSTQGYTITGEGTVEVTTAAVENNLDLTSILTKVLVVNSQEITMADGAIFKINASNYNLSVLKDGTVATVQIAGDVAQNTNLDLRTIDPGIAVDLLGTGTGNEHTHMQLGSGANLYARAEQLAGESVQGAGTIVVSGDASAGLILSDIAVNLDVSGVTGLSLTVAPVSILPDYQVTRTLTLSYAQVTGATYDAGQADVVIKFIEATQNADLSGLSADKITSIVDDNVTFIGNFGDAEVSVDVTKVLTTSAAIASGVAIGGLGELNISGDITEPVTVDLTKVSTSALTFWDNDVSAIEVVSGAVLQINADTANGLTISGTGTVDVRDAQTGVAYDFSTITAATSKVNFVDAGQLHADTNLTGVDEISLAAGTTEFSAEQANGRVFSGLGAVKIYDAAGTQNFKGTGFNDTFWGQGSDSDVVDFSKQDGGGNDISGSDTVRFSGDPSDMSVTGLTFGAFLDNTEADVLDFSNLSGLLNNVNKGQADADYQGISINTDLASSFKMTGYVIGLSGATVENERGVADLFSLFNDKLNKTVDAGGDMVFLIANAAGNTNVWHWHDVQGAGQGDIQQAELTKMGTLVGVGQTDISLIVASSIHFIV
jgi:hypothetical protein